MSSGERSEAWSYARTGSRDVPQLGGLDPNGLWAIGFDRPTFHYKSRRVDQAAVEKRIKEICETRVRYGYRRVHVLLDREGWGINIKKVYRIYRELGMQLRNKTPKRRVKAKLRDDLTEAVCPNDGWAMDFVDDQLATGKKLRILTVVDTFSRYVPVLVARHFKTFVRRHPGLRGVSLA